ncbi:hypothetical protein J5N97_010263 [Dioscorea zingiberensis]|uniref:Uncharacterized protein n=1 Tax=Dioscorea zingiberensis TaxID=325984 RepID=A0A9D5HMI7_9LILI|nr:hypothetical protein J5N97_010263 [Dioscorea zingiberensis]
MEPAGEEEQDGVSAHSPSQAPPSSATSLSKVELELRVLEALETYPILKLKASIGTFSADEVLQLLDKASSI